ncbi:hypothetical protein OROGR_004792 [Orobanche gracilis]
MIDKMVFARSFSRREQKFFACGAFVGCFIIAVTLSTVFRPYIDPPHMYRFEVQSTKPSFRNLSNSRSDVYEVTGDVRIHCSSSTIFIASPSRQMEDRLITVSNRIAASSWTVKPYARRQDTLAMGRVTTLKVKYVHPSLLFLPNCNHLLSSKITPAIIFSTGGYAGNHFHAFTDVLLPLYFTSHQFNRNVLFLVLDKYPDWISKYKLILEKLSKYDVVHINDEKTHDQVLCFSRVIIGLKANKEFTIDDPINTHDVPYSMIMTNFTKLVRSAYSLQRDSVSTIRDYRQNRPRMLIVCRRKARNLVNKHAIADMARGLGFDVVLKKMVWNVSIVARLVNSFDVMVGVHGAGLTNMVFLPEHAIIIQIIPFGLDFIAKTCFQIPACSMNLRYLEYKANLNESSFSEKYSHDNYTDSAAMKRKGFDGFRSVYLDNQDLNLDIGRFQKTLLKALELLRV